LIGITIAAFISFPAARYEAIVATAESVGVKGITAIEMELTIAVHSKYFCSCFLMPVKFDGIKYTWLFLIFQSRFLKQSGDHYIFIFLASRIFCRELQCFYINNKTNYKTTGQDEV